MRINQIIVNYKEKDYKDSGSNIINSEKKFSLMESATFDLNENAKIKSNSTQNNLLYDKVNHHENNCDNKVEKMEYFDLEWDLIKRF